MQTFMREFSIIKKRILQYLEFKGISKYKFYDDRKRLLKGKSVCRHEAEEKGGEDPHNHRPRHEEEDNGTAERLAVPACLV